jgi:transposase-like protein/IS1 family transposase
VTCHNCKSQCRKFGYFGRERIQRYRCNQCNRTFSDIPERPLDNLRIPFDKAVQIVGLLVEGVGIRAIERLTQVHRDTVLAVLEVAGQKCARIMDERVRNVPFESVQVDELFCFVHCKEKQNEFHSREIGDQYVFLGIDAQSKFIINFAVGKRDAVTTQEYVQDLARRVRTPFQLTTDGFKAYESEVYFTFQNQIHFAQLIKEYACPEEYLIAERRYSPPQCIGAKTKIRCGNPSPDRISTSYVERTNLSVRLFNRRFTRLTLGYSKKLANLKHSVAMLIAHFNFCRVHGAHKQTPAQACGLADHAWTIPELLSLDGATQS